MSTNQYQLKFLKKKQVTLLEHVGSAMIGVPIDQLGDRYIEEIDEFLYTLPPWVQKDFKLLLWSFNFIFLRLFFTFKVTSFTKMNEDQKMKYIKKWGRSHIPLMRSGVIGMKGVVCWGYYSQNEEFLKEIQFPGKTIGRENVTPTHLFGKEPWKPSNN